MPENHIESENPGSDDQNEPIKNPDSIEKLESSKDEEQSNFYKLIISSYKAEINKSKKSFEPPSSDFIKNAIDVITNDHLHYKSKYEIHDLRLMLKDLQNEDLKSISEILKTKPNIESIIDAFYYKSTGLLGKVKKADITYSKVLNKVANDLKIPNRKELINDPIQLEKKISYHHFNENIRKLNDDDKRKLIKDLEMEADKTKWSNLKQTSITATVLGGAQLSGFGIYMAAASSLSAISGLLGITLSLSTYFALSSVINTAIGPVGWAVAAYATYNKLEKTRNTELLAIILAINTCRAKFYCQKANDLIGKAKAEEMKHNLDGAKSFYLEAEECFRLIGSESEVKADLLRIENVKTALQTLSSSTNWLSKFFSKLKIKRFYPDYFKSNRAS